jgi:hypothetical protein
MTEMILSQSTIGASTPALDKRELRIIKRAEIPPVFAQFLKEKSLSLGVAFAVRISASHHRYLMPASPKPISVKTKTGNWSFTKGVISVDPALGLIENKNGAWELAKRHPQDLPLHKQIIEPVLHRISLQEVLAGLSIGEYALLGTEADIQSSGRLCVKAVKHPTHSDAIFSINLMETAPRVIPQCPIDFKKMVVGLPIPEVRPAWWNEQWGAFDDCLSRYYPAQYREAQDDHFRDIFAYGVKDENNDVLPITGDQDLLWISMPTQMQSRLGDEFAEVMNTLEPGGVDKLYAARLSLYLKMGGNEEEAEKVISNSSIAGLGCVTPYESYVIDEVNRAFADSGIRHLRNLIQHAAENHNPDHPAPLDAPMVHIWKGCISLTQDENELVQFYMQKDFPDENHIDINHHWDMAQWAPAIYHQLVLKQPILPATMTVYRAYRQKNKSVTTRAKPLPDDNGGAT